MRSVQFLSTILDSRATESGAPTCTELPRSAAVRATKECPPLVGVALTLVAGIISMACGEEAIQQPPATVASVVVTPAAGTLVSLGETLQLTAVARDANGSTVAGVSFTWSSDDQGCAAVNSAGLVTAAGNGTATVTATTAGVSGSASITVAQELAGVEVTPPSATITSLAETVQLAASAHDANGNAIAGTTFTWESSDESIATVSTSGLVTAVANGAVTVTATTDGVRGSASLTVAQAVSSVEVTPATVTLVLLGATAQLTASAFDANGNAVAGATFTWESSDEGIATVSSSGLVTAVANGSATITATSEGQSGMASVTVSGPSRFAGKWQGETNTGREVSMSVTDEGIVDSMRIYVRMYFVTFYCTGPLLPSPDSTIVIEGDEFSHEFFFPLSNITSTVHGVFSSESTADGTYSGYSGSFTLICGSTLAFGSGSPLAAGSWEVTKDGSAAGRKLGQQIGATSNRVDVPGLDSWTLMDAASCGQTLGTAASCVGLSETELLRAVRRLGWRDATALSTISPLTCAVNSEGLKYCSGSYDAARSPRLEER